MCVCAYGCVFASCIMRSQYQKYSRKAGPLVCEHNCQDTNDARTTRHLLFRICAAVPIDSSGLQLTISINSNLFLCCSLYRYHASKNYHSLWNLKTWWYREETPSTRAYKWYELSRCCIEATHTFHFTNCDVLHGFTMQSQCWAAEARKFLTPRLQLVFREAQVVTETTLSFWPQPFISVIQELLTGNYGLSAITLGINTRDVNSSIKLIQAARANWLQTAQADQDDSISNHGLLSHWLKNFLCCNVDRIGWAVCCVSCFIYIIDAILTMRMGHNSSAYSSIAPF